MKYLPYFIGVIGLILVVAGIILSKLQTPEPEIVVEKSEDGVAAKNIKPGKMITVDIEGAVVLPGVYHLPYDSRIVDALIPAGGLSDKADRKAIAKTINMAQKISDGSKVYFPFENDTGFNGQTDINALLNINSATLEDLDKLPGIGLVTGQKIITNRPYQNVSDLLSKKVLSTSVYTSIKDKLSVY